MLFAINNAHETSVAARAIDVVMHPYMWVPIPDQLHQPSPLGSVPALIEGRQHSVMTLSGVVTPSLLFVKRCLRFLLMSFVRIAALQPLPSHGLGTGEETKTYL
jgi:hypothetical protein